METVFRIRPHGGAYGHWWKVQVRLFFVWITLDSYIFSREDAENKVEVMIRTGGGRWSAASQKGASDD